MRDGAVIRYFSCRLRRQPQPTTNILAHRVRAVGFCFIYRVLTALPPRSPRCFISTVRVQTPSSPLGFCSTGFGASVTVFPVIALQGRQIAFERPCRHPRTFRRELSGEVRNCHLKPSNRSSDSLNDLLNSSSESIASSSDFMAIKGATVMSNSRVRTT